MKSVNPKNQRLLKTYSVITDDDITARISWQLNRFQFNKSFTVDELPERQYKLKKLRQVLEDNKERYAKLITNEMGKPIKEARAEMTKAIGHIDYYVAKSPEFLATEELNLSTGQTGAIYT